jgi:hypothetical protein
VHVSFAFSLIKSAKVISRNLPTNSIEQCLYSDWASRGDVCSLLQRNRPTLQPHPASHELGTKSYCQGIKRPGRTLTTHCHTASRLRMCRAIPLHPLLPEIPSEVYRHSFAFLSCTSRRFDTARTSSSLRISTNHCLL